jgi:hypothetical protein
MQTIRYSEAFDCLILERAGGHLSYFQKTSLDRLIGVLQHYARQDRAEAEIEDAKISAERVAALSRDWLARQPPPPGAEIEIDLGDLL